MVYNESKSLKLYYCYEPNDKALCEELEKHLTALLEQGQTASWHAGEIKAGTEWQKEIAYHLQNADVILFLFSANFIAAKKLYLEDMRQALERHARNEALVIPMPILRVALL